MDKLKELKAESSTQKGNYPRHWKQKKTEVADLDEQLQIAAKKAAEEAAKKAEEEAKKQQQQVASNTTSENSQSGGTSSGNSGGGNSQSEENQVSRIPELRVAEAATMTVITIQEMVM